MEKSQQQTQTEREKRVRLFWEQEHIFEKSVAARKDQESFVFYEGPPTANGMPHVGHALGRTIKDIIARFQTMAGKQVVRKAGWDTHGLPVELGVEKALGISGKQAIEDYGVEAFIQKCKESVFSYEKQWRDFTKELGYWVDMENPYMTMSNEYIESVWHILGTIHDKGLLYKGHKVSPYCPSCQTSLSSHEVAQGYKDVKDLSATVKFKLKDRDNEFILGWTTTPWTLPANVALAVNAKLEYVRIQTGAEIHITAKALAQKAMSADSVILETIEGSALLGLHYEAPFSFITVDKGHYVVHGDFVTADSGTGIVHIAPAYGEDDYRLVQENDLSFVQVVDGSGKYTEAVTPLAGRFVKDCDVDIIKLLHEKGLLFHKEKYEHSYPHCWRCDSPLLYYALESWFIQTTAVKEAMIANNQQVNWYPDHIKDGRFGNFLEQMVDWNISRSRYWGTPLNVWECPACKKQTAPKSIADLENLTDSNLDELELHKPYVDNITFPCPSCSTLMVRTPEVIDVWFDSGSMPFAQYHAPFENKELWKSQYPADVVVEGIDQTRGWFYSLLAVSTLYNGELPYKNVLATGHVLDENGQKMSKSKGNALDPVELIHEYGADSLRWALIEDSAPWNQKRFSVKNVQEAKSKLVDTLTSLHHFYKLYADIDGFSPQSSIEAGSLTLMDKWANSRLASTVSQVNKEMENFQLTNAARHIGNLLEDVSNWYIRRNRERFWSEGMTADKTCAYHTLYNLLVQITKLLAPFTPFTAEDIHYKLTGKSVHLEDFPKSNELTIDLELEQKMSAVREIVELGRSIRHQTQVKTKQPLAMMAIVSNELTSDVLRSFSEIIKSELNVKQIDWAESSKGYIQHSLKLNFKNAGKRLGKLANPVHNALSTLTQKEIEQFLHDWQLTLNLDGQQVELQKEDVLVYKSASMSGYSEASNRNFTVIIDTSITAELAQEGFIRDFIRSVQDLRKQKNLPVEKRIDLKLGGSQEFLSLVREHESLISSGILLNNIYYQMSDNMVEMQVGNYQVFVSFE
ncbi:isoleucine--tRNA ligase [Niallia taxi]|uniref:isoleucine--tRNA ligase n=1 Tax=Niallia taxi TaxID=2499688 RepID=UPI002E1F7A76|nr:isoleucine--tRNA ligase [Niallia taxi]MED4054331.1 isoleucine--tRNA ligase [Niallia taxi]MED4120394.1 isoleucine--tRNA ligase [Niallia taxi]